MITETWKCLGCDESNQPDADLCHLCGFAKNTNFQDINQMRKEELDQGTEDTPFENKVRWIIKALFMLPLTLFAIILLFLSKNMDELFIFPALICVILTLFIGMARGAIALIVLFLISGAIFVGAWMMLKIINVLIFSK